MQHLTEQDNKAIQHYEDHKNEVAFESPEGKTQYGALWSNEHKVFYGVRSLRSVGIDYALFVEGYEIVNDNYAAGQGVEQGGNGEMNETD